MFKKNLLQLFLIFILFFSFFLLYQKYFKKSNQIDKINKVENKTIDPKKKNIQENKKINTALETLEVYSPLAQRLGMKEWQEELDDLSFKTNIPYGEFSMILLIKSSWSFIVEFTSCKLFF